MAATNRLSLIILVLLLISCKKTEEVSNDIHPELKPYFDSFTSEGNNRLKMVDLNTPLITGQLDTLKNSARGLCFRDSMPKFIQIDILHWDTLSHLEKEFIVFHELGHCYLNRGHDDSHDPNFVCNSLMHASPQSCLLNYNEDTRSDYLDELFK